MLIDKNNFNDYLQSVNIITTGEDTTLDEYLVTKSKALIKGDKNLFEGSDDVLLKNTSAATFPPRKYVQFKNMKMTSNGNTITVEPLMELIPTEKNYFVYGVAINTHDSNPSTRCKFLEDSLSTFPVDFGERPCMFKDGQVQYYLDENDFTKKEDGTDADITSGEDGDVMIEIPQLAYLIRTKKDIIEVKVTNHPNPQVLDADYCYNAFATNREGTEFATHVYVGAYMGHMLSGKLRSLSGKAVTTNITIAAFRNGAHEHNVDGINGYGIVPYHVEVLLQCMYLVKYGNTNGQQALGQGHSDGSSNYTIASGQTNTSGMYAGNTSTTFPVKFAGIENWYGRSWEFVDGLVIRSGEFHTAYSDFRDAGEDYTPSGIVIPSFSNTFFRDVVGNNELGFAPLSAGSSSSSYWGDVSWTSPSSEACVLLFGGSCDIGASCGPFCFNVNSAPSSVYVIVGARLCFRGRESI